MSRIREILAKRFPENDYYYEHVLGKLLSEYEKSKYEKSKPGLASRHLVKEIETGEAGKLWARVWEAMLYRHLLSCGFQPHSAPMKKSEEHGPDFRIVHQGQTIWIEAVAPAPEGIPPDYLEPPKKDELEFRRMLDEEPLLRWISVLRSKRKKLESDTKKGIIGDKDCTIIAINSCRLHDWVLKDLGKSGLPFAVEATLPFGPLAYPITPDGQPDGGPVNFPRNEIPKQDKPPVLTANFIDPDYANVSALLGCYHKPDYLKTGKISLTLVHNPLAANPLPRGILDVEKEYIAEVEGDRCVLWLYPAMNVVASTAPRPAANTRAGRAEPQP